MVVDVADIFIDTIVGNSKLILSAVLTLFLTYVLAQKYNVLGQNKKLWLSNQQSLKDWIWILWMAFRTFLGDGEAMYQYFVNYASDFCKDTPRDYWVTFFHTVYVDKPQDLQIVLNNSNVLKKCRIYNFFGRTLGEGLITAPVSKWKKNRRRISPFFSSKHMVNYMNVFNSHSSKLVETLRGYCDTDKHFDLWNPVSRSTISMIWEVAVGKEIDITESIQENLMDAFEKITEIYGIRIVRIWMYPVFIYKLYASMAGYTKYFVKLNILTKQILETKKKIFKPKMDIIKEHGEDSVKLSYVDQFLKMNEENENGEKHTDKEMLHELNTMIAAGSEPNAITSCFTLIMLAMNPEIQEKVYSEIVKFSGEEDENLSMEQVGKMTYLEQCVQETLRLFPPVPFVLREATNTFQLNDHFTVKENSNVIIPILMVHRNPDIYPNPLQWNPDNFAPERVESRHKYSFLAFSAGVRACIGGKYALLAIRTVLIKILKNYRLDTDYTMDDLRMKLDIVLRSATGYKIKMHSRRES